MIEVQDVAKTYVDGTEALRGITLSLDTGMYGLLGPNGAGKTTFLSILTLALEPSRGHRSYFELDDRVANRPRIRSMVGYLPQEFEPIDELTGKEYLLYCAALREVPLVRRALARRVDKLLEAVELGAAAKRRSGGYSGGMKRRLGLASALLHSPRFLVVDEPTAGLDPEERIRFRNLITSVADRIPVLLSTHIVEDIEATCPRVGVLAEGRLLYDGTPGEILHRVQGMLWEVAQTNSLPAGVHRLRERIDGEVASILVYSPVPFAGARPIEPTLEDAYEVFLANLTKTARAQAEAGAQQ